MNQQKEDISISLRLLISVIFKNWVKILIVSLVFAIAAILLSYAWPKEFESNVLLLPESNSSGLDIGSLSGLAGLAGINIGNLETTQGISVKVYSKIVSSTELNHTLLYSSIDLLSSNDSITVKKYLEGLKKSPLDFVLGFVETIRSLARPNVSGEGVSEKIIEEYLILSQQEYSLIEELKDRIAISYSPLDGVFNIKIKMQDRIVATQILDITIQELEKKLIDYKINKEKHNAEFIMERMNEAEINLNRKMEKLASFIDQNKNRIDQGHLLQEDFLRSEYNLALEIYSSMANQYAQALIKIEESKPEFVYLDAIQVPVRRSSPRRIFAGISFFLFGAIISVLLLLIRNYKDVLI
ncbi:Wzz/FepE/Etk N-terminal domain-containing protein [Ekhidna sp.]